VPDKWEWIFEFWKEGKIQISGSRKTKEDAMKACEEDYINKLKQHLKEVPNETERA